MLSLKRSDSKNPDFIKLVQQLDAELAARDGEDHAFYHPFNSVDNIIYAIVLYDNQQAVGCGALKAFDAESMEVKRMFVSLKHRGKGFATQILKALEQWAKALNYKRCVLETGKKQPEAIALYAKRAYNIIPNYGPYEGIDNSVCFEKLLPKND